MKKMAAAQFKARCLRVMEAVRTHRAPVLITKRGKPVAKLVPADAESADVFDCMAGTAHIAGDVEKPVTKPGTWKIGRAHV